MPYAIRSITCEHCGSPWDTRNPDARFCSAICSVRSRQNAGTMQQPRIEYAEDLVARVRELYEAGHTMQEVANLTGTTTRVLERLMSRHQIERRTAAKRNQSAEANHMWKGPDANYQALHLRVEAARGKPNRCACCDTTDPGLRYEWANLSGQYDVIADYARLCIPCHRRLDAARRAATGKPTSIPKKGGRDQ